MPNMIGETFVSKGIKYVLQQGPKGNLRPYTVGPVTAVARKGISMLPKLGLVGLAIGAAALIGVGIWYACKDEE